jgi:hypothetical protein
MSIRGISDPTPELEPETNSSELESALKELILSHNMLHDRLVRLEAIVDKLIHIPAPSESHINKQRWRKG